MLEDALQWVEKNVKEEADLEEFRKLIPSAEELAKHPEVKPHFDRAVTSAVKTHDTKFTEEKLPDIIKAEREKLMAELNPEETIEQKLLRETREEMAALKKRDRDNERKAEIRKKSNELDINKVGLSPDFFETFAAFGDDALPTLEAFMSLVSTSFNEALEKELASRLGTTAPKAGVTPTGSAPKTIDEAQRMFAENPQAFEAHKKNSVSDYISRLKQPTGR